MEEEVEAEEEAKGMLEGEGGSSILEEEGDLAPLGYFVQRPMANIKSNSFWESGFQ